LKDTVPDVQDDHPLQNISSEWYYKYNKTCFFSVITLSLKQQGRPTLVQG